MPLSRLLYSAASISNNRNNKYTATSTIKSFIVSSNSIVTFKIIARSICNRLPNNIIKYCYHAEDIEDIEEVGAEVSRLFSASHLLLISGDLGEGKTFFDTYCAIYKI